MRRGARDLKNIQFIVILEDIVHVHNMRMVNELHDDHLASNTLHDSVRFGIDAPSSDVNLGDDLDRSKLVRPLVPSEPYTAYRIR